MTRSNNLAAAICEAELIFSLPKETAAATADRIRKLIGRGKRVVSVPVNGPETADRIAAAVTTAKGSALIGVAGVTDSHTARAAILAGVDFISTPFLDTDTVHLCHRYGKLCIPGALPATEVLQAVESGCDLVGLCPAQLFGPKLLKAVRGPLPQANLVPSGGIGQEEASVWIQAGAAAVEVELAEGPVAAER